MKSLPIDYIHISPTILSIDEIIRYLDELMVYAESLEFDKFEVCEALCELVQVRMGDNLQSINSLHAIRVFKYLSSYWPNDNLEHLDSYLTVLININLGSATREYLLNKLNLSLEVEQRKLIEEALDEIYA